MGYLSSPVWTQGEMTRLFEDMDCVEVYIDNIAAFSNDLPSHLIAISKILSILNCHDFSVKAIK